MLAYTFVQAARPSNMLKFQLPRSTRRYRANCSLYKCTVLLADRKRPLRVVVLSALFGRFLSTRFTVHFYSYTRYKRLHTRRGCAIHTKSLALLELQQFHCLRTESGSLFSSTKTFELVLCARWSWVRLSLTLSRVK